MAQARVVFVRLPSSFPECYMARPLLYGRMGGLTADNGGARRGATAVANSSAGDVDMIYMHAKHRVAEGTYVCDEASSDEGLLAFSFSNSRLYGESL